MIPANLPSLPGADMASTGTAQMSGNAAASAEHGDQFAKALDKASAQNNSKASEESKSSKSDESHTRSDETKAHKSEDDKGKTDKTKTDQTAKADDTAKAADDTATPDDSAAVATDDTKAIAPKQIDVSTLTPLLPTTAIADTTPAVDPALTAQIATTAPVLEDAAAVVSAVTTSQTSVAATAEVAVTDALKTINDTAKTDTNAIPVTPDTAKTDASAAAPSDGAPQLQTDQPDTPTLPAAASTATEIKKDTPKQAAPQVDANATNALNVAKAQTTDTIASAATTKATAASPHAEPYKQVMQIVHPLRGRDGDHSITISLMPENLGRVDVQINIQSNNVSMQMNADNPQSRQLLRESLNDLRNSLNESGLNAGSLDVGSQDAGQQFQQSSQSNKAGRFHNGSDVELSDEEFFARLATSATSAPVGDGPLDIRA